MTAEAYMVVMTLHTTQQIPLHTVCMHAYLAAGMGAAGNKQKSRKTHRCPRPPKTLDRQQAEGANPLAGDEAGRRRPRRVQARQLRRRRAVLRRRARIAVVLRQDRRPLPVSSAYGVQTPCFCSTPLTLVLCSHSSDMFKGGKFSCSLLHSGFDATSCPRGSESNLLQCKRGLQTVTVGSGQPCWASYIQQHGQ